MSLESPPRTRWRESDDASMLTSGAPTGPIAERWDEHKFRLRLVNPANRRRYRVIVVGSGLAGGAAARPEPTTITR